MIPVAVALMTPIPLLIALIIKKCFGKKNDTASQDPATESMLRNNFDVPTISSDVVKNENQQA